jgi:hypothetical protein
VLLLGAGIYFGAATASLLVLRPALSDLLAIPSAPEVLAMSRGLQSLLILLLYVPSMACLLTSATVWLLAGERRNQPAVLLWLFAAFVPFAIEHAGTALVVILREPPASPGDVIASTQAFSFGPRLLAEAAGWRLGAISSYWAAALSLPAVVATYCWGRALAVAGVATQRARRPDTFDNIVTASEAAIAYVICAGIVLLFGPPTLRLFMALAG